MVQHDRPQASTKAHPAMETIPGLIDEESEPTVAPQEDDYLHLDPLLASTRPLMRKDTRDQRERSDADVDPPMKSMRPLMRRYTKHGQRDGSDAHGRTGEVPIRPTVA